jgi:hypothetical protein
MIRRPSGGRFDRRPGTAAGLGRRSPVPGKAATGWVLRDEPDGPKNTRVSAILFVRKLTPWAPELVEMAILHDPLAEYPLPQGVLPVREFTVTERDGDRLTAAWLDSDMDA